MDSTQSNSGTTTQDYKDSKGRRLGDAPPPKKVPTDASASL
uniref:Uncharacterized protein n=1 Tax=Anguilla anguilla TaxID=7936 RepID=A0A0E9T984_ANGAN